MEVSLAEAVGSSAAMRNENRLTEVVNPAAARVANAFEKSLDAVLAASGRSLPTALASDQGAYVTTYDKDLIGRVLASIAKKQVPEGVVIVVMASSLGEAQAAHRAFRAEIRSRLVEVVMGTANSVAERLSRKYGRSRVQVKPGTSTVEDQQGFLAAALLAIGRVVFVRTSETVQDAFQVTVGEMLRAEMRAERSIKQAA